MMMGGNNMELEYINGREEYGLQYDWKLIANDFKKLKIPGEFYNPTKCPFNRCKYFINLSDRSAGKSTNWLLLGMCMYIRYGTQIQYIRQRADNIAPRNIKNLFSVILQYNYVSALTNGIYNTIVYKSKRWYLANVDDAGEIINTDKNHFMFMASIDRGEDLKSSYNAPFGDFILFDEFINSYYYPNEFVHFCDLVKSIIRDRRSPIIVMLANTIDRHSTYFRELEIYDRVQTMLQGDSAEITTAHGTKIYIEILGKSIRKKNKRDIINKLFFGFKNPELASITGEDWAMHNYQHIPDDNENTELLLRNIYIYYNEKYIRLDIVEHEYLGLCIYVHWAFYTYDDSIILTCDDRYDSRFAAAWGTPKLRKFISNCIQDRRIYFASNDVGAFFESYLRYTKSAVYL